MSATSCAQDAASSRRSLPTASTSARTAWASARRPARRSSAVTKALLSASDLITSHATVGTPDDAQRVEQLLAALAAAVPQDEHDVGRGRGEVRR